MQLARAEAKRDRAEQHHVLCRAHAQANQLAQRSSGDLLAPAKEALAEAAAQRVERMLASDSPAGRRPKGRAEVSRPTATSRGLNSASIASIGRGDEIAYLLHSDPELNVPVTSPGGQPEQAQRREGRQAMIHR